ncbi:uncharacterized protein LOC106774700 [Vigna radiata var. radiata]|uniref:Uncharacterized protein LOC106774700 n=1 Tax=Vigna radiata var. radiata TaxID=3916 RepID=A0A1S3VG90_VIGRR|nr:uncharacterized protein LOC106774700 [Vigna radiata var. radiata]
MAEATRLKDVQAELKTQGSEIQRLLERFELRDRQQREYNAQKEAENQNRFDQIQTTLERLLMEKSMHHHHEESTANTSLRPLNVALPMRNLSLDFPHFDGKSSVLSWIFKAEKFFNYHNTPDMARVDITAMHFEGEVVPWFQMLQHLATVNTWLDLTRALQSQFRPSPFDCPMAELFKLQQTGSISDYYLQFMSLANRSVGLIDEALLNCFLSGLNVNIKRDVMALSPISLLRAVALAKLYEDKYCPAPKPSFTKLVVSSYATKSVSQSVQQQYQNQPYQTQRLNVKPPLPPLLPTQNTPPLKTNNVKRISLAEMQLRRDKEEEEIGEHDTTTEKAEIAIPSDSKEEHHLSLNAMKGGMSVGTIRFLAYINQLPMHVLIDGGSSDNFLQPRIAKFLKLPVEPAKLFRVMVGNGNFMTAEGKIQQLNIQAQGHSFVVPVFLLPISGADLILGASWLKTIGPHIADYGTLQLKLLHESRFTTLQGDEELVPVQAQLHHIRRMVHTNAIVEIYNMKLMEEQFHSGTLLDAKADMKPDLALLLHTYVSVFDTPHHLPPQRSHDHAIPLLAGSNPVKVKPYRYPHSQKEEIERLVEGMLKEGIIQHSKSPFSSPIILV